MSFGFFSPPLLKLQPGAGQECFCFLIKSFQDVSRFAPQCPGDAASCWDQGRACGFYVLHFIDWICHLLAAATQSWVDTTTKPIQDEVNLNTGAQHREVEEKGFLTLSVHTESGQKLWV